jgi:hypothetical protein
MNLLIPYVHIYNHTDPLLKEFTYGDIGQRARKLASLKKGEYIFFHTSINGKKCITAYFVVDRTLDVRDIAKDRNLLAKYKNPHIIEYSQGIKVRDYENVVVFGDPILSRILNRPLPFDKTLAQKLSLDVPFPVGRGEGPAIGSATRAWRNLNRKDVGVLLKEIKRAEGAPLPAGKIMSTEEVSDILERDVENYLEKNSNLLGKSFRLIKRQYDTPIGRIDLLFENSKGDTVVVELKLGKIGREAVTQLRRYVAWMENQPSRESNRNTRGIIICSGVMPAFDEEFRRLKDIKIFVYGWQMKVQVWPEK